MWRAPRDAKERLGVRVGEQVFLIRLHEEGRRRAVGGGDLGEKLEVVLPSDQGVLLVDQSEPFLDQLLLLHFVTAW